MMKLSNLDIEKELLVITNQLLAESRLPYKRGIKLNDSLQRHLGIDSLGRSELFKRIEKTFGVMLTDRLFAEAETLNDIANYLAEAPLSIKPIAKLQKISGSHQEKFVVDVSSAKTLLEVVLTYAEKSPDKSHIYFYAENGQEETVTYGQLLHFSLCVANVLRERGLKEGETVAIMQPTNLGFFYTFLGILFAGGIPVPIYPPFRMHMLEAYAQQEARILRNAEVRFLVTFKQAEKLSRLLQAFVPSLKQVFTVAELLQQDELKEFFQPKSSDIGLLQYTSGSTSDPKGVLLTHANLLANIRAYGKGAKVTADDVAVSWVPLYHDLGLIAMWLGSLYHGAQLILLTPFTFLNHPERWLWAIHYHRGTISGAPNFAYELCVRKIDQAQIEGLSLSSLRILVNGAEKIYLRTLEQFATKFAPYELKSTVMLPVYGLAESTVGLLIPPLERDFLVDYVDRKKFEEERKAVPTPKKPGALDFVSCGVPIEGHEVRITDDEDNELPERTVGTLQFRGPSTMQGYYNNPGATQAVCRQGWMDSGDLGYQAEGEIFITGRRKDLIIKAGRNIYPAEIEELVGVIPGIRQGCVIAFGTSDVERGTEQLVIVAETREQDKVKRAAIIAEMKSRSSSILGIVPDVIFLVAPHAVPKTSSGKLQRAACKKMYLENRLGKRRLPVWLQIVKLGAKWLGQKSLDFFTTMTKFIYTSYVAFILIMTLLPLWLIVFFASSGVTAKACRLWARFLFVASFCPLKIIRKENLAKSDKVIFTSNHASYMDSIVMLALLPPGVRFVGKKEVFSVPLLRTFGRKLGSLAIDRLDLAKGIEDTKQIEMAIKNGDSILIFPEGTFGYAEGLRPFRLGAFKLAAETNTPICPVALKGTRTMLREEAKLLTPGSITVTICEPISPFGSEWQDIIYLRHVVRAEIANYCGEGTLDFIAPERVAPRRVVY